MDRRPGAARSEDPDAAPPASPATRTRAISLLTRDRPILRHDVDPRLTGIEPDGLTARVPEREDVEDVGTSPRDVLALAVAEDGAVAGPDQGHIELRVSGGIDAGVGGEVDLRLDDDDVSCGDRPAGRALDLAHAVGAAG